MSKFSAIMLTSDQMLTRLNISRELQRNTENILNRIVTYNGTWVHHFDHPESKVQHMKWEHQGSPSPKKFKRTTSAANLWDSMGLITVDYLRRDHHWAALRRFINETEREYQRNTKGVVYSRDPLDSE